MYLFKLYTVTLDSCNVNVMTVKLASRVRTEVKFVLRWVKYEQASRKQT